MVGNASASVLCSQNSIFSTVDEAEKFYSYNESLYSVYNYVSCKTSQVLQFDTNISGDVHRLVKSCTSCADGSVLTEDSTYDSLIMVEEATRMPSCYAFPGFKYCRNTTVSCSASTCDSKSKWVDKSAGYQEYHQFSCKSSAACVESVTKYRCATNYYGTTTNGTSGCTACPSGKFCPAGSTSASACKLQCASNQYKDGDTCKDCPDPLEYMTPAVAEDLDGPHASTVFGTGINSCYYTLYSNVGSDRKGTFYIDNSPQTDAPDCHW